MSSLDNWTDDELRRIVEGRGRDESFDSIGYNIGRSKNAVIGKLRRCVEESDKHEGEE